MARHILEESAFSDKISLHRKSTLKKPLLYCYYFVTLGEKTDKTSAFGVYQIQYLPALSPHLALVFLKLLLGSRGTLCCREAAAAEAG